MVPANVLNFNQLKTKRSSKVALLRGK